jgi:cytochrome P450
MAPPPRDRAFDNTLRMLADPYRFVSTRCAELGSDVIETRIMLRRAVCAVGEEAARVFYHPDRFTRRGALPITALLLLQDRGSAATLDANAHRHRKRMLMSLMTPDRIDALSDDVAESWRRQLDRWEQQGRPVAIASEVPRILCRAVCRWVGVRLDEAEVEQRTRELVAMYPFFPLVAGRARTAFDWRGHRFARGTWMMLDLYGTDRDPRSWERPDAFWPERFRDRDVTAFTLIPQGGGDPCVNHRCAGEWITIEIMKRAVRLLTTEMRYDVPAQDLRIDMSRMPAVPRSRFVISNVKRVRTRQEAPAMQRTGAAT